MAKRSTAKTETIEDVRKKLARITGLMSRVHGNLRLEGVDFADREKALEDWCQAREETYRSMVEGDGANGSRGMDTL